MRLFVIEDHLSLFYSILQLLSTEIEEEQSSNRDKTSKILVLLFTEWDLFEDQVTGLESKADVLSKKSFQAVEIKDRIRAILKRYENITTNQTIKYHGIQLFSKEQRILVDGTSIKLTAKQYRVLEYLIQNKGIILTKEQIHKHVWGFDSETDITIVEVFIHNLRKKLEPFGYHTEIITVRGVGYTLSD